MVLKRKIKHRSRQTKHNGWRQFSDQRLKWRRLAFLQPSNPFLLKRGNVNEKMKTQSNTNKARIITIILGPKLKNGRKLIFLQLLIFSEWRGYSTTDYRRSTNDRPFSKQHLKLEGQRFFSAPTMYFAVNWYKLKKKIKAQSTTND